MATLLCGEIGIDAAGCAEEGEHGGSILRLPEAGFLPIEFPFPVDPINEVLRIGSDERDNRQQDTISTISRHLKIATTSAINTRF